MANRKVPGIEDIGSDETLLCKIKKHPFGLISVYVEVIVGLLIIAFGLYYLLPKIFSSMTPDQVAAITIGTAFLLALLAWVGLTVFTFIYQRSFLLISDQNVVEVIQEGLLNRKVSELSLTNVEDVTAVRHGFFATTFNFGILVIETAGEAENFVFMFCPNPTYYGKVIMDARRDFLQKRADRRQQRGHEED